MSLPCQLVFPVFRYLLEPYIAKLFVRIGSFPYSQRSLIISLKDLYGRFQALRRRKVAAQNFPCWERVARAKRSSFFGVFTGDGGSEKFYNTDTRYFGSQLLESGTPRESIMSSCSNSSPMGIDLEQMLAGNTKVGSISVPLTSCLIGLDKSVLQIKPKIVSCHIADSKPVK
jgi:hypothetical protein